MRSRIKVQAWEKRTSQQKTQEKAARATEHGPKRGQALTLRAFAQTPLCLKSILFQPAHAYSFKAQPMSNVLQEALLSPPPQSQTRFSGFPEPPGQEPGGGESKPLDLDKLLSKSLGLLSWLME